MSVQLEIPWPDPPDPLEVGRQSAERCAGTAERGGWDRGAAMAFVLAYLARHGPTPGETLVTEASRAHPPHDARAFGAVFMTLSRRRLIEKCGTCVRAKGHGTAGGIVWRLARAD